MKINIGPYKNWIGPYQIAEMLCFWAKKQTDEFGIARRPDWVHDFGQWLGENRDGSDSWLTKVCQWIHSKQTRRIKIKIDPWDTWSMDNTLSLIILPMLRQLHANKHGAPHVDDADVPEHLRSTSAPPKTDEHDVDDNHFKRWDWVMEEMIWTFEQLQPDYDWEEQYHSGESDIEFVESKEFPGFREMIRTKKDTHKFDVENYTLHNNRISNGTRLFGKYFRSLWD